MFKLYHLLESSPDSQVHSCWHHPSCTESLLLVCLCHTTSYTFVGCPNDYIYTPARDDNDLRHLGGRSKGGVGNDSRLRSIVFENRKRFVNLISLVATSEPSLWQMPQHMEGNSLFGSCLAPAYRAGWSPVFNGIHHSCAEPFSPQGECVATSAQTSAARRDRHWQYIQLIILIIH